MEHRKKLEELNAESLQRLEDYLAAKKELKGEHHEKLHSAKEEWQNAWIKLREVLMVLERIEI
ncbi:MAG: hypothetical protein ABIR30_06035 [Chitinophagaceae bacterium]